ncbi:MAG TPA: hypothetical protein VGO46_12455 [Gemmatimonadaceae bacterium]|jgi:hypothetical protein|nr:hypothetical protein [Gemmatimonadaceae bacterium]
MTVRRSLGVLALFAMMHFIIAGTASACVTSHATTSAHTKCAPASSHSSNGAADHTSEGPCCTALSSCAATPLAARTVSVDDSQPMIAVASANAERAPRADAPAPELPPPKA